MAKASVLKDTPAAKRHVLSEPDGQYLRNFALVFTISLSVSVIEIWLTVSSLNGALDPYEAFTYHGYICVVLWLWLLVQMRILGWVRGGTLITIATTFCGPVGALGSLYSIVLHALLARTATPFEDWYMSLFPEEEKDTVRDIYEDIVSGRDTLVSGNSVGSFSDILSYGNFEQKLAVIALLSRHFRPAFAPPLKLALKDENAAIRVRAATAVAEIENGFLQKSMTLGKELERNPGDYEATLALAKFLDDYAFSGILDEEREAQIWAEAHVHYKTCYELRPDDEAPRQAIGRILVREGRIEEATEWFELAKRDGIDSPRMEDWHLECLFRLGRYEELEAEAAKHYSRDPESKIPARIMGNIVSLWSGDITFEEIARTLNDGES